MPPEFQDLEALWSVVFIADGQNTINGGVVILETNRIFGGDSWYYYTGTYTGESGKLQARVTSTHYAGPLGSPLMGSLKQGNIDFVEIERRRDADGNRVIALRGTLVEAPDRKLTALLTWRSRLPG